MSLENASAVNATQRIHIDGDLADGSAIEITGDLHHYLSRVMRARSGTLIRLFNGRDGEWLGAVETVAKRSTSIVAREPLRPQAATQGPWLVFAPPKRAALEFIIEKGTELGVTRFMPVLTERSVSTRLNVDRLRRIAVEASEQSERLDVPLIDDIRKLPDVVDDWDGDRLLCACIEREAAKPLLQAIGPDAERPWALLTGPEGGFASGELDGIRDLPFCVPVTLGSRILRAETAAMAAVAIGQAAFVRSAI